MVGHVNIYLVLDLSEVLSNILVAFLELLLGIFGDLSCDHGLLIFKKTIGTSKEAIEGYHLLKEAELRISRLFLALLHLDSGLDGVMDLGINLSVGHGTDR